MIFSSSPLSPFLLQLARFTGFTLLVKLLPEPSNFPRVLKINDLDNESEGISCFVTYLAAHHLLDKKELKAKQKVQNTEWMTDFTFSLDTGCKNFSYPLNSPLFVYL